MTDNNKKILQRSRAQDSGQREIDLYNDIQIAIVAVMAAIIEAGHHAGREGALSTKEASVKRARMLYAEAMNQVTTEGI